MGISLEIHGDQTTLLTAMMPLSIFRPVPQTAAGLPWWSRLQFSYKIHNGNVGVGTAGIASKRPARSGMTSDRACGTRVVGIIF